MSDLLTLTAHLPEVELAAGDVLVREGTATGSIWVLLSGALRIEKDGVVINTVRRPGLAFGEMAVILDTAHSATVVAAEPTRLRYAEDGRALLTSDGEVMFHLAQGLAERLDIVTSYLADLRNQYADAPGIAMVSDVLGKLVGERPPPARPGSARDPDPEY